MALAASLRHGAPAWRAALGTRGFALQVVDSSEAFNTAVAASDKAVAYYTASWCGPCRMIAPHIDALATEHGESIAFLKVDIDEQEGLAQAAAIRSVPTFQFLQGGAVVDQVVGADADGVEAAVGRLAQR